MFEYVEAIVPCSLCPNSIAVLYLIKRAGVPSRWVLHQKNSDSKAKKNQELIEIKWQKYPSYKVYKNTENKLGVSTAMKFELLNWDIVCDDNERERENKLMKVHVE
jgi:hypothetical protein